jgi:hypothetical protein
MNGRLNEFIGLEMKLFQRYLWIISTNDERVQTNRDFDRTKYKEYYFRLKYLYITTCVVQVD